MPGWNFSDVWDAVAAARPDKVVVVHGDRQVRSGELDAGATAFAGALVGAGIEQGAKVSQYLYNCTEYIESYWGCYKSGITPVNTNYRYLDDELVYLWTNADVEAVVFHGTFSARIDRVRTRVPGVRLWLWVDDGDGPCPDWALPYDSFRDSGPPLPHDRGASPDDIYLLYTGGTTGMPKGVMWRQSDYFDGMNQSIFRGAFPAAPEMDTLLERIGPMGRTTVCGPPLMHGTALGLLHVTLTTGGTIVLLPSRSFDAEEMLDEAVRTGAEALAIAGDVFGRPLVEALDAHPERWDLNSLKEVTSAGMMFSEPTKRALLRHAPHLRLTDRLGSTEVPLVADSRSSGKGVHGTATFKVGDDVVVLDDELRPVAAGSGVPGRLAKTGPLPLGYYKDPEKSAQTFPVIDGVRYGVTGDYAIVDADGTVHLLGRGSVCINTGGEKVFPEEVEEVVKEFTGVADAVVVGVPDDRYGERVVAVVEPSRGTVLEPEELVTFVKSRLAGYKAPRHVVIVESMLRGPNAKADYAGCRELAIKQVAGLPQPAG
ncbi:MAG TPA: AMP-binding protein [Acidimicrobiales bacterium]|nr:AMP-binding protein [Acidimicrobiales bacterium]